MAVQAQGPGLIRIILWTAGFAAIAWVVLLGVPGSTNLGALPQARPQLDLEPFWAAPEVVQVHLATVILALVIGPIQFAMPKGTPGHRWLGWIWALAMLITAIASLFIREINDGGLSPIHIFSFWTFVSLPLGVWFARRGMVGAHKATMIGLYIGLLIAGVLSAAPGRLTWEIFLG